jgi:hypothetical protein
MNPARVHAAAGAINAAAQSFVYVRYGDDPEAGFYLPITRVQAKAIVAHAREHGVEEIDLDVTRGKVFIGSEIDLVEEPESA